MDDKNGGFTFSLNWPNLLIGILVGICCALVFLYIFSKDERRKELKQVKNMLLKNLEDIILIISGAIFIIATVLDSLKIIQGISLGFLNIFATIIFSWLLTKKSSEFAFKKEQEKLAKLSYRHLGDVEKAVLGLEQSIINYTSSTKDNDMATSKEHSVECLIHSLQGRIESIKNGILSNKEDWYDMLSEEYKGEMNEKLDPEDGQAIRPNIDFSQIASTATEEAVISTSQVAATEVGK